MFAPSRIVKTAVVLALPLVACFGYYTAERLGNASTVITLAAVLAAPLALIGLASTVAEVHRRPRRGALLAGSLAACLAPALFLVAVWS